MIAATCKFGVRAKKKKKKKNFAILRYAVPNGSSFLGPVRTMCLYLVFRLSLSVCPKQLVNTVLGQVFRWRLAESTLQQFRANLII